MCDSNNSEHETLRIIEGNLFLYHIVAQKKTRSHSPPKFCVFY